MEKKKTGHRREFFLGAVAGLVYTIFIWGYDALVINASNGCLAWVKFGIGLLPMILVLSLIALISASVNNLIIKVLIWMATATSLGYLTSIITFQGTSWAFKQIFPEVSSYINYVTPEDVIGRLFVIIVMTNILFIFGGLFIDLASESLQKASGIIGMFFPAIICLTFFAGAGYVADSNLNIELREQIIAVNEQIEAVAQLDLNNLSEQEKRMIRRFTKLDVDLKSPRKLMVGNFDMFFSQVEVLINFDGVWTKCLAMDGRVGNCGMLELEE
jgi:hypothetical protein